MTRTRSLYGLCVTACALGLTLAACNDAHQQQQHVWAAVFAGNTLTLTWAYWAITLMWRDAYVYA